MIRSFPIAVAAQLWPPRSHSSLPFPDLGKEDEDVPAAGFSTDSTELWKEPEAPSARNAERAGWRPFLTEARLLGLLSSVSVLLWLVGEQGLTA